MGEAFGAANAAAARDDDVGFGKGDSGAALGGFTSDFETWGGEVKVDVELLRSFGAGGGWVEDAGFDGYDCNGAGCFDGFCDSGQVGVVLGFENLAVGAQLVAIGFEADDVFEERRVEFDGDARTVLAAAAAAADEDDGGFAFLGDLGDCGDQSSESYWARVGRSATRT